MKKLLFFLLVISMGGFYAYTSQSKSVGLSARYNAAKHSLTIQASNTPISAIIAELAKSEFSLFIQDLDTDFRVTGRYLDRPVDEVLAKMIPAKYHYHYRVNDEATEVMLKQKSNIPIAKLEQRGSKVASKKQALPKLAAAETLVSKTKFEARPKAANSDASLKQLPRAKTSASMKTASSLKPMPSREKEELRTIQLESKQRGGSVRQKNGADEHVVVTFRVTENGMEAVESKTEAGRYIPSEQAITNEFVVTGSEGGKVIFLESVGNPLIRHSITDPSKGMTQGHGDFKQAEGYVTVKMPKKYANVGAARNLKVELAQLNKSGVDEVLQKFQKQQLRTSDLSRSTEIISRAPSIDLSKTNIIKRQ